CIGTARRIATRLPAVGHIASIKYPTLLNDPALANDNKNCSWASPSRDLALASPPSPQQTAAACAAPSPSRRVARSLLAGGGRPSGFRPGRRRSASRRGLAATGPFARR